MTEKYQPIPHRLKNLAVGGHVAGAEDIDAGNGKTQQDINASNNVKFAQMDDEIEALEKHDVVPVDTLPSVSEADTKKIYRVADDTSYTDYMVNAEGTGWKELAEFSFPGIDNGPTKDSENIVFSKGLYEQSVKNKGVYNVLGEKLGANLAVGSNKEYAWKVDDDTAEMYDTGYDPYNAINPIPVTAGKVYELTAEAMSDYDALLYVDEGDGEGSYGVISSYTCSSVASETFYSVCPEGAAYALITCRYSVSAVFKQVLYSITEDIENNTAQTEKTSEALIDITGNEICSDFTKRYRYSIVNGYVSLDGEGIPIPISSSSFDSIALRCSQGDGFTVTAAGINSDATPNYMFIDSSGLPLKTNLPECKDTVISAPENAAWLIVNALNAYEYFLVKGVSVKTQMGSYVGDTKEWESYERYSIDGDVGSQIEVVEDLAYSHGYIEVDEGDRYIVTTSIGKATMPYNVIFANVLGSTITVVGKGISRAGHNNRDWVTEIVTVPSGANRMYVNAYVFINNENTAKVKAGIPVFVNVQDQIKDLNGQIEEIRENLDTANIPSYYMEFEYEGDTEDYISKKLSSIRAIQNQVGSDSDSFFFLTDYHHIHNQKNSPDLVKYISERSGITRLIFCGDVAGSSTPASDAHKAWNTLGMSVNEYYAVLGNHEWQDGDAPDGGYTLPAMTQYYLQRFKKTADGMDLGTSNYYVDNDVNKIRYYFIQARQNTIPVSGSLEWLAGNLGDIPSDYSVIVFAHYAYVDPASRYCELDHDYETYNYNIYKQMIELLQAFNEHTSGSLAVEGGELVSYDYTGKTGSVIGVITGHQHHSYLFGKEGQYIKLNYNSSTQELTVALDEDDQPIMDTNQYGINVFCGGTDSLLDAVRGIGNPMRPWFWSDNITVTYDGTQEGVENQLVISDAEQIRRTEGTIYEQCFYVVMVDKTNRHVTLIAIGGDHDWEFDY